MSRDGQTGPGPEIPLEREGQYTRLEELGRGGQSVVLRAFDEFVARDVALKELVVLPAGAEADESSASEEELEAAARRRFLREARLMARLDHPGIVSVLELARRPDGTIFCAQKLVRGETLKARLARCTSLSERLRLLPHLIAACQAVAYAHSRGVIHRDLKPSNIMVGSFGETVVVDWGLAKARGEPEPAERLVEPESPAGLTRTGLALGTPGYMSPEQGRGERELVDERSDVFSLGVILYELLTGRVPFSGATAEHVLERLLSGQFHPVQVLSPEAPAELTAIAERALEIDPGRRYPSADSLARELSAYLAGGRVEAYHYGAWELVRKFISANRALSAVAAVAALILLASVANVIRQLQTTRRDLANSFLERARAAELVSDWGRAAGYYEASRAKHDTLEARWGSALARERIPRRVFAHRGRPGEYVDVGFDATGKTWFLSREPDAVVARRLEDGRELWRFRIAEPVDQISILGGAVRLDSRTRLRILDPLTGTALSSFDRLASMPCPWGPPSSQVLRSPASGMWEVQGPQSTRPLIRTRGRAVCAVSADGARFAVVDDGGTFYLWDVETGQKLDQRPAPDASQVFFTPHGVAIVRSRSVQVFGGPGGDFSVDVPERAGFGSPIVLTSKVNAMSADGHRLVIAGLRTGQATVIDLRDRRVVASISFPAGEPRFEFTPTGDQLIASGLANGSVMIGWDLRPRSPERPVRGSDFMALRISANGQRFVIVHYDPMKSRYEVFDDQGTLLLAEEVSGGINAALSGDGARIAIADRTGIDVREVVGGRRLQRLDCRDCRRLELSGDGARALTANLRGLALWDVSRGEIIWEETARFGALSDSMHLAENGRNVVWARGTTLYLHDHASGKDRELPLDSTPGEPGFSKSGDRIAVATDATLAAYATSDLRPLWKVAKASWVTTWINWSSDDSVILVFYESMGTVLHDATTGQRIATIAPAKPGAFNTQENVLPRLKQRISRANESWELIPIPQPNTADPSASLASVLSEAGLQLQGAELVDALPDLPTGSPSR